jgi:diguanylate cyclase (GGDEF)-like protein
MDTQTLLMANVLLFGLYAGVILVNSRMMGGVRGGVQFAAANLCRGAAILVVGMRWLHLVPRGFTQALTGVLAVVGLMLLYQSFAALLERSSILQWVQGVMVIAILAIGICVLLFPIAAPMLEAAMYGMLGVQLVVTAALVFRCAGPEAGFTGWLTGVAMTAYGVVQFMRAIVMTRFGRPGYAVESAQMNLIWMVGCLLSSAVIAFGYMGIAAARLRAELLWRAQVDELTGLLNRWALKRVAMLELQRAKARRTEISMLMMDLDGLKQVNDSTGHACGDVVLQAVAGVLQETLRAQDSVGRMGGDEFCVVLPETSLREAMTVAERLRSEVEEMVIQYRGDTVQVKSSLGVTSSEISGLVWQALIDDSDSALYRAKRQGRNRVMVAIPHEEAAGLARATKKEVVMMERRRAAPRVEDMQG